MAWIGFAHHQQAVTRSAVSVAGFKKLLFCRVQRPSPHGSWSIVSGVTGISHGSKQHRIGAVLVGKIS